MKGIIGRKLGMTQIFDPESGRVTPVTVIEAGPCPVVQVKTVESDGYEAVQLAFDVNKNFNFRIDADSAEFSGRQSCLPKSAISFSAVRR